MVRIEFDTEKDAIVNFDGTIGFADCIALLKAMNNVQGTLQEYLDKQIFVRDMALLRKITMNFDTEDSASGNTIKEVYNEFLKEYDAKK